jgi:hypothetical protein
MTQPVTPWLPGQSPVSGANYGRLRLPGVNDQVPSAPYGMLPGQRHVLPDQINLDPQPVKPDEINLDDPNAAPPVAPATGGPGVLPQTHKLRAIRVMNEKGEVVANMPVNDENTGNDYYKRHIQSIGDALQAQAVNPADKGAAVAATQYAMSLIGLMPFKDIQAAMMHHYEADERNVISRETQAQKSKRAAMVGHGGPATGPSKGDKAQELIDKDVQATADSNLKDTESQAKLSKLNEYEQTVDQLEAMMGSGDALSQRAAVAEYMKTLTGKQSTDIERRQILGANGAIDRIMNDLRLWNPGDASMTKAFRQSFIRNVGVMRANVQAQRKKLAQQAADALGHNPFIQKHGDPEAYRKYGSGRIGGDYGDAPPAAAPGAAPAVPPHLQRFVDK